MEIQPHGLAGNYILKPNFGLVQCYFPQNGVVSITYGTTANQEHLTSSKHDVYHRLRTLTLPQEMVEDLDNMYGEFDPYGTADATLHDPDFGMKTDETFDTYLARYTATIAPLQLPEREKISQLNLTRTITRRLRLQMINGIKPTIFKDYVKSLRQCDLNMRPADKQLFPFQIRELPQST